MITNEETVERVMRMGIEGATIHLDELYGLARSQIAKEKKYAKSRVKNKRLGYLANTSQ